VQGSSELGTCLEESGRGDGMKTPRPTAPLLAVKQIVPTVRAGAVRRDRLEDRLSMSVSPLTLVVAPAGWGKTTLLSSWAAAQKAEVRLAWVSLDEGDDEPLRFWRYVIRALGDASDTISPASLEALLAAGHNPLDLALPTLLNELSVSPIRHVLVLDDFHVLGNAELLEQAEYVLNYLPPSTRLILSSRQDPPFPIARLRACGQLTEIRADELRFDRTESDAMLAAFAGPDLHEVMLATAWERTEGWAAGLQLAGLAMRNHVKTDGRPAMGPEDRHLLDYFAAEVMPALSDPERNLLVHSAHLDRLSGSLCDAALECIGSAALLDRLDAEGLFVLAIDAERRWYRCHHLFRQALLREAALSGTAGPEVTRGVLTRAAQWFAEHELLDDAVRCLVQAGDGEQAAGVLMSAQSWFLDRGLAPTLLDLADRVPERCVAPALALGLAYAAEASGRQALIARWLDVAEAGLTTTTTVGEWRSAQAASVMMRGLVGTEESDSAEAVRLTRRAVELERNAGDENPQTALLALGAALARDGQFEPAAALLHDAWRSRNHPDWSSPVPLHIAGLLGFSLIQIGRLDEFDRLLSEAGPLADRAEADWGATAIPLVMLLRIADGRRRYCAGTVDAARAALLAAVGNADAPVRASTLVTGLVFLADAELACGDGPAARRALDRAQDLAAEEPLPAYAVELLEQAATRIGRRGVSAARRAGLLAEELTDRELAILRTLPGSATQREIGSALHLSINTIKAYNKQLYRKLGVGSRAEAVAVARRLGLI
jgi:LuxR family maltose regulon positive regulatory protein